MDVLCTYPQYPENKSQNLLIGRFIHLTLVVIFLLAPFGYVLAESDEQHTAQLIDGAKNEGKLLWYVTFNVPDANAIMLGFNKKYPFIKTDIYRAGSQAMVNKVLTEALVGRYVYDVIDNDILEGLTFKQKGIFGKYLSPQRRFYLTGDKDPEGYWTGIYANKVVLAYNTRLISSQKVPTTYQDLLDPKWKGKMGMDTKAYYEFAVWLSIMGGGEKGLNYMKKLSEQDIQFRTGRTLIGSLVAAGEMSIGLALYNHIVEQMKEKGAPVEWLALEPVIDKTHPLGVSARAPHPNAARLFVDYVLSREGQEIIANLYRVPTRTDVEAVVPKLKCKDKKTVPPDLNVLENFDKYIKLYNTVLMKK